MEHYEQYFEALVSAFLRAKAEGYEHTAVGFQEMLATELRWFAEDHPIYKKRVGQNG